MTGYSYTTYERQYRRGELHPRAKLTDDDVDLMRDLYDAGCWSYSTLGALFGCSRYTVRDMVKCRRR